MEHERKKLTAADVEDCRTILAALEAQSVNRRRPGMLARAWRWLVALVCCAVLAGSAAATADDLCREVDLAFADGSNAFRPFASEAGARAYMLKAGTVGVFIERELCSEPVPQCHALRFYPANQVLTIDLTRFECAAGRPAGAK